MRFGDKMTRFTVDLDAARSRDVETFTTLLEEKLEQGWNGFTGRLVQRQPPSPEGVPSGYVMQPFEVKLSYLGKSWVTVPLEVGHNEIGDAEHPDYAVSADVIELFSKVGLPVPGPVPLMQLHHQISQKLHGLSTAGSDRVHDLIDLQIIVANGDCEWTLVRQACERLFAYRAAQEWPPVITKGSGWDEAYAVQGQGLRMVASVDEAVEWVNRLVENIASS